MKMKFKAGAQGALAILVCGCASQPSYVQDIPDNTMKQYLAGKPVAAQSHFKNVLVEGDRNKVLNEMRTSLIALELGELEVAEEGFDSVLESVEAIYSDNKNARKARSKFRAEKTKEFKGEGYERAMAFYYRGLLYLADDDYENARASFLSAQLQDGFAEQQKYASDFASMDWLAGWASHCRALDDGAVSKNLANEYFRNAKKLNKALAIPDETANILLIVETGTSPTKKASPKGMEYLEYARGEYAAVPKLTWAGTTVPLSKSEDLYWQASTRGGRQVDAINAGKAEFKQSAADTAAASASAAGASMSVAATLIETQSIFGYSEDLMNATGVAALGGLFGALVSGASSAVSDATKPEADVRYWDNLPDKLHFGVVSADQALTSIHYAMSTGKKGAVKLLGNEGGCELGWLRTHSALNVPAIHVNAR